jgi:N-acetylmuramoyl-L-alanine amidase-like protein
VPRLIILPLRVHMEIPGVEGPPMELPTLEIPSSATTIPTPTAPPPASGGIAVAAEVTDLRSQLPRQPANTPSPATSPKRSLTVHWLGESGPPSTNDEEIRQYLHRIAFEHIAKDWGGGSGGSGIMYHEAIAPSGRVFILRDPNDVLWHAGNAEANTTSRAILVLCSAAVAPNATQIAVLRRRHRDFGHIWWGGHQAWSPTACPGPQLMAVVVSE